MTTKKLEPRTFFDPATGYAFEVYVEEGAPPLPGQWADPNPPPLVTTLSGARVEFAAARASGRKRVVCPCCDKPANFYKRKLNSGMVDVLIRIYRAAGGSPGEIVSIEQIFGSRKQDHRDWPLLRHWGLVQPASRRDSRPRHLRRHRHRRRLPRGLRGDPPLRGRQRHQAPDPHRAPRRPVARRRPGHRQRRGSHPQGPQGPRHRGDRHPRPAGRQDLTGSPARAGPAVSKKRTAHLFTVAADEILRGARDLRQTK